MVRWARPVPVEPNTKFESTESGWWGGGYTTRSSSGPSTGGIAGSPISVGAADVIAAPGAGAGVAAAGGDGGNIGGRSDAVGTATGTGAGAGPGTGERAQAARNGSARAQPRGPERIRDNHMEALDWPLPEPRSIFGPLGRK